MTHVMQDRRNAFSLIEVLIAIVVLALGLLGIAAVFPAVVTQQRATTDAVQGENLARSVEAMMKSHYGANAQSPRDANGLVARNNLRGWASMVGLPAWSQPNAARMTLGNYDGDWSLPNPTQQPPGIRLDPANGNYVVMGTIANVGLPGDPRNPGADPNGYASPGFRLSANERKLAGEYMFDFAARRKGAGRPFVNDPTNQIDFFTCQDDMIQLAVFVRRADRKTTTPAIGVDANGRPTFNGTGTYSTINRMAYSVLDPTNDANQVEAGTDVVKLTPGSNETMMVNYLRQVGQKLVTQWGTVHTVVSLRNANDEVAIKPPLDLTKAAVYSSSLQFLYTPQVPMAVHVFEIEPQLVDTY